MIILSAIKHNNIILIGKRHSDIIRDSVDLNINVKGDEQGFIDEAGNFYNRTEALIEAFKCEQISEELYLERINGHKDLFSEDLW